MHVWVKWMTYWMSCKGTEVFLDSLSTLFSQDHGFMLCALQCLRLSRVVRDQLGSIFSSGGKVKVKQVEGGMDRMLIYTIQGLLYAMIVAKGQLVTLLRPRKHSLHPAGRVLFTLRMSNCWILTTWR